MPVVDTRTRKYAANVTMGVSVGGQVDIYPYFLKWRGRPVFCPAIG